MSVQIIRFAPGLKPVLKHLDGEHDQKTHGNWATGAELDTWNPLDPIPDSPKNAGGMTAKAWEAWEHGPDGQNFIALFRKYACQELGLEVPKTPFDQGGYLNYMMDRGWGKPSRDEAKGMLNAIANGRPQPALYRGMYESNDSQDQANLDALLSTKPGDTFDMPLVSATRSLGVATWYAADMVGAGKRSVVMKIQEGAKGVALKKENSTYPQDHEVITSGKFEVVSINKVSTPYWSRSIFEPRKTVGDAQYPDHYEIATFDKTRFTPEQAKIAWDAVSSGNYKSLETPTFKLTADRSGGGLSSWTKQEGKEFTVVEVKMVEPHTVQKSQDLGNQFFFLFNNMPFIHDEPEDVAKHGTHDQSSHGNWAHGSSFGDFTLDEGADSRKLATYSHPNGTRVIFQNLSKVESSSPMVKETLENISDLSKKYPIPNLTFVVQSGEGGGIIARGYDGVCYSQSGSKKYSERIQAWLSSKNMPETKDVTAPYIAVRQRVLAPDSAPKTTPLAGGGLSIRPSKTQEQKTAYLKELITHEWGHALDTRTNAISSAQFRNRDVASTSKYGNKNGREFFAETFAASELGGLVKDRPDNIPNYSKAAEYLQINSLKGKVSKESFEGFICYENFETGEPLLVEDGLPLEFNEDVAKHGTHDQKTHGNWATGGLVTNIEEWAKSELSKFSSETEQEIYLLQRTMSQAKGMIDGKYKDAVNAYQTATGYTINEALRDPQISEGQVQPYIDGLDNAIKEATSTTEDMTVYRGIKGNGLDFFESLKSGDVFQDKGFVSTTLDPKTVTKFSVQGGMYQGIVMRMQIPAGSKGLFPMSVTGMGQASSREAEFILPRDSKFKILSNEGKVWNVGVVND